MRAPGTEWRLRTVAAILANPRYTGRQVWNRHRTDHEQTQDELPGLLQARRLNAGIQWAVSAKPTHPAVVSVHDFVAAQAVNALAQPRDGTKRTYLLVGLLRCGLCGRSLESQWSHGNPCYRCRHGHTSAQDPSARPAANLHLREDVIVARALAKLHHVSSPDPQIRRELAHLRRTNEPVEFARFLRDNAITITCHQQSIALELDSTALVIDRATRIPVTPVRGLRVSAPRKLGHERGNHRP